MKTFFALLLVLYLVHALHPAQIARELHLCPAHKVALGSHWHGPSVSAPAT